MDDYRIVARMAAQLLAAYKAASGPKASHEEQVANRFEPARRA